MKFIRYYFVNTKKLPTFAVANGKKAFAKWWM